MSRPGKKFAADQIVEYCPTAIRDTSRVQWYPAKYIRPHRGAPGRHLVSTTGNIVSVPDRRLRGAKP